MRRLDQLLFVSLSLSILGCPTVPDEFVRGDDDDSGDVGDDDDSSDATPAPSEACPDPTPLCDPDCRLDIDVPLERVSGTVRWDGAPIAADSSNGFELSFHGEDGRAHGMRFNADGQAIDSFDRPMLQGTWTVYMGWTGGPYVDNGGRLDSVEGSILVAEDVAVPGPALDVMVAPERVTGTIQWDGAPIGAGASNAFSLTFTDVESGIAYWVYRSAESGPISQYDVPMFPGTYDVEFAWEDTVGPNNPSWPDPILGRIPVFSGFEVPVGGASLNIGIDPVRVTGSLSWDGMPVPESASNEFELLMVSQDGRELRVRRTAAEGPTSSFDIPALQGSWRFFFNWAQTPQPDDPAWPDPLFGRIPVTEDLNVTAAGATQDVAIELARVSGELAWDGAPIPPSIYNDLAINFVDQFGELRWAYRDARDGELTSYDIPMLPGTHDVFVNWVGSLPMDDADWPDPLMDWIPVTQQFEVAAGGTNQLPIDPELARITGSISWDGEPIPEGQDNWWVFTLSGEREHRVDRDARLGDVATFDIPALGGEVEVGFEWVRTEADGPDPIFGRHRLGTVDAPGSLDVAFAPVRLTGAMTWGGEPIPEDAENRWALRFIDPDDGHTTWVDLWAGEGDVASYDVPALPGIYHVEWDWTSAAASGDGFADPVWGAIRVASCVLIE